MSRSLTNLPPVKTGKKRRFEEEIDLETINQKTLGDEIKKNYKCFS